MGSRIFRYWTSITGNNTELELCVKEDIWIRMGNSDDKYISIKELRNSK